MKLIDYLLEEVPVLQITKTSPASLKFRFFTEVLGFPLELIKKEIKQFKIVRYYFTGSKETLYEEEDFEYLILEKLKGQITINTEILKKEILSGKISKETDKKIDNLLSSSNSYISKEEFLEELKTSKLAPFVIYMLTKNPKKQNIPEKESLKFLQKENKDIKKLPQSGKEAVVLDDNGVLKKRDSDKKYKAIDFYIKKDNIEYYILQKYTEGSGGAQDSQFNEAVFFLINANKNLDKNVKFVALLDGDYYKNILNDLKKEYNTNKAMVMNSNEARRFFSIRI